MKERGVMSTEPRSKKASAEFSTSAASFMSCCPLGTVELQRPTHARNARARVKQLGG